MNSNKLLDKAKYPFGGSVLEKSFFDFYNLLSNVHPDKKICVTSFVFFGLVISSIFINLPKTLSNIKNNVIHSKPISFFVVDEKFNFYNKYSEYVRAKTGVPHVYNYVKQLKSSYPEVNFKGIKSPTDATRHFLGRNNFIALAAEMEGFRSDLHKDPATGLNIGYGYNITKRIGVDDTLVRRDLLSVGIRSELVDQIVMIAQLPQNMLDSGIEDFNKLNGKHLIDQEQGLALLSILQEEYKVDAKNAFPSFYKMGKNQQDVLTYAAYKTGGYSLSKFKGAINKSNKVYRAKNNPTENDLKYIAKELNFYYKKDGNKKVLDKRANLIAHTFVNTDKLREKTVNKN